MPSCERQRKSARTPMHKCLIRPMDIFAILVPVSLLAVLAALAFGVYAMFRGGNFGRSWSNRAMRLRVLVQLAAILALVAALAFKTISG